MDNQVQVQDPQAAEKKFARWLKNVPPLADVGDEITVNVSITLPVDHWLTIARVAAMHDETLEEAVVQMVYDVSLEDDFMNDEGLHLYETREKQERRAEERADAQRKKIPPPPPPLDGDEWKTA